MLSKLLKYDLKAICKYFIPMTIFILGYSLLGTLLFNVNNEQIYEESDLYGILIMFIIAAFIVMIIAYYLITQGIIIVNFFKSMTTDTGYLTHTLPVKKSTIIVSKVLTGIIILLINTLVLAICLFIFFDIPKNFTNLYSEANIIMQKIIDNIGMNTVISTGIASVILLLTCYLQSLSVYFTSIAFGQLMNRHKVIGSFISYFIITFIFQIASTIFSFILGSSDITIETLEQLNTTLIPLFLLSTALLQIIISAALLFTTNWIFTKKLNLD